MLCSLLIGGGYDSYVVSGFAHKRRVADRDLTFCKHPHQTDPCPTTSPGDQEKNTPSVSELKLESDSRYPTKLRPKKEFKSNYEQAMAERELVEGGQGDNVPPNVLEVESKTKTGRSHGQEKAVHFWVLVVAGKRDVAQSFFVEPSTGMKVALDCPYYYDVVSVWNHENYWVNMQSKEVKLLK